MANSLSPALPGYEPDAEEAELSVARGVIADRLRERGLNSEADAFEAGERDWSWAMHHELRRVK